MNRDEVRRRVLRVTLATMIANIGLAALKGAVGWLAGSAALLSDAANSASDVVHEIIVMIGVRLAAREADDDHPYGHERFESVVSIILGVIVFLTGASIGIEGLRKVWEGLSGSAHLEAPEPVALWVAAGVIVFKGALFLFTRRQAHTLRSDVLRAAAADHGADVLGTLGGLIGIAGARLGLPIMDPLACLVIAAFILRTGVGIFATAVGQMTDKSGGEALDAQLHAIIAQDSAVVRVDRLHTRLFGDRIYVDVEIALPGTLLLDEAHEIAERVHETIEAQCLDVKHCMVHVNPC
jgi:cation diffusion facilitator family transporter